ncbi:hypothetical protein [Deinococcus marmoris]|uniref:Uncharacterized protein n=1 Tax=Deinococcus marmoris TaxID=249408 RepID=A0A1U7NRA2_9DEIO|nr:hypothetical protein [Deinococcus marmoris]OLV15449.1 hypothetical protein BOO71_0014920 [Deinococcus marmoris]OLV15827.1 hypothetical protein BOO71_0013597 [Deinococcus marmoris]
MSDSSPVPPSLLTLAPLLGAAFVAGGITQLARLLGQDQTPRARTVAALAVAAGIAALTVVALMTVTLRPDPAPALLLAAACVTGWSGPGILARLGALIERRLGLSPSPALFAPDPAPAEAEGRGQG